MMVVWVAVAVSLALAGLAVGLSLVALFGETWRDAQRAEVQRRTLDQVFSHGFAAGYRDGQRSVLK